MMSRAIRGMPPVAGGILVFEILEDGASGDGASVIEKGESSSKATSGVLAGLDGAGAGADAAEGLGVISMMSTGGGAGARVAAGTSSSTTDTASGAVSSTIS